MTTETEATHTPGPWKAGYDATFSTDGWGVQVGDDDTDPICTVECWDKDGNQTSGEEPNARFIAAACTSYDKHCGANAIRAAESDLLGELLDVCSACEAHFAEHGGMPQTDWLRLMLRLRNTISKATGKPLRREDDNS